MITLVSAAMLASGVATTAWHLGRAGGDPRDAPAGHAALGTLAPSDSAVPSTPPSVAASAARPAATAEPRIAPQVARAPRTSRPAARQPKKSPIPEVEGYGPEDCRRTFALASFNSPLMVVPCHALGERVRIRASVSAPPEGTGALTVSLRETGTGRAVGSPLTCDDIVFAEGATTHDCGPATVRPARGRSYQVVVTWTFSEGGRPATSTVRGHEFAF